MKKTYSKLIFTLLLIVLYANLHARTKVSINANWYFINTDVSNATSADCDVTKWQVVNIPHTWNAFDTTDDTDGYYRDVAWYRRLIHIPVDKKDKQVTIFFEGANQEVELFVNGKSAGTHVGGYTRFSFDITKYIQFGVSNLFAVKVNNRYNKNIPPLTADFTFFGGIYRDVHLIYTNKQHISTTHYASEGVYFRTLKASASQASVEIKTLLNNADGETKRLRIEHTIVGSKNNVVYSGSKNIQLKANAQHMPNVQLIALQNPELWSPETPALHKVYTRIYDAKSKVLLDEITQPLGIRWFEFTAENGFYLNGKPYKLIGTNRHQCYKNLGNALPDEIHVSDVKLLKAMGGNFLRVSHYPQDPVVMEMCDKLGIITKVEIPIVNAITESDEFTHNSIEMVREMVFQDYNRPSVLIWAYMNEVLLRLPFPATDSVRRKEYFASVNNLAQQLENQIRTDDPERYTLIPMHGNFNHYHEAGLTQIPMIVGWNLYQGWYTETFDRFDMYLDNAQAVLNGKPFIITEYGADVDPRLHSFEPTRFDYTQEYANLYHEHYIKAIMERKYVVGANIWNLNDFHSEERGNAVPHINNKGVTTLTREPKDTYLHYQAMFSPNPIVNIGGQLWKIRGGNADANNTCVQPVKVYSNRDNIELFLNGKSLGKKVVTDHIAAFDVPFIDGENVLEAIAEHDDKLIRDMLKVDFRMIPNNLNDINNNFSDINIMLGSRRYFQDLEKSVIWIPEKEYTPGSWGYVGGRKYAKPTRHGEQPASDANIKGTNEDPIFQTMRLGIEAFNLDVPNGEYTVSFYLAELQSNAPGKTLIYNLGDDALKEDFVERIFDISINGAKIFSNLNIAKTYGENRAVIKKVHVSVADGNGINIDFKAIQGETMLNAIRVYKNY